jgi:predicted ferric reductase
MIPDSRALIFTLAAVSFLLVTLELPADSRLTLGAFSLGAGVSALALMAAAAILGARWQWVESAFGGLDRVYRTHKWLGIWALVFASAHFLFKADSDSWTKAAILALDPAFARLARQSGFIALMLLVLLALNRNIPYSVWRWWHKLSGPALLVVVFHAVSIKSPIALVSPAGVWLATLCGLGLAAAVYKLLLYPLMSRHAAYEIVAVEHGPSAVHLDLRPLGQPIRFEAGQFAFLSLSEDGLREPHPFTIASGSRQDGRIQFVIRALGDYTQRLVSRARTGMHADLYAPFGRFERLPDSRCEIWIGGGVGISPFVAWLSDADGKHFDRVSLFYFCSPGRDFPDVDSLRGQAEERGAAFVPVKGGGADPAFGHALDALVVAHPPATIDISFCGPKGLLQAVRTRMHESGIPAGNIRYEIFEFR